MKKLILASSSPRRKQLLEQIGLDFEIDASNIDEVVDPKLTPIEQVELFSLEKAQAIAPKYKNAIILAADTMVTINGEVLGKPKDKQHAIEMLNKINGTKHMIATGFTLIDTDMGKTITRSTTLSLWFRKMSQEEIAWLIDRDKPFDKAGAYAIQESASMFIERFEGDYFGAVGLPLYAVAQELKQLGISVL
jgi:septum formation protein